ncbi:Protein of unknown function DUF4598 [Plasmopara halstedii]|uniref:Uncharacterized protein n=1 Tax=Plasmopara halstedii TaxID=4781 RepID=A0A0N7L4W6_PLAHL|nr:Protein of unknown function DUF4598 [Plasmopara halstedii]CEG39819.1 Protein of unknown function DUF4598 [Plasmopara halstedii]|eukprot:XP_024576188.1 Protein of unknown function DUF4598 [Plasmopara halstedii]
MQDKSNRPTFTNVPKSQLLSKLEAFLPMMEAENKKLSEAVAAGEGAKHNIEIEESEDDDLTGSDEEKKQQKCDKVPVIEMNFAISTMDEGDIDSENLDAAIVPDAMATRKEFDVSSDLKQQHDEASSFQLQLKKPSNKPHAIIQELN